ncbi:MAG: YigZ family protein [Chloroflexota bacterium]|nr:YigZ family protein [Chloroflexota bacterium]
MPDGYLIPAETVTTEIVIRKSRFLTTVQLATTVVEARHRLTELCSRLPAANHHVYAFRVGFGNSVTEGMSDDGEPTGTAGPPTLAVLRGSGIGDVLLVTARFFGGTKLGTGGLVRAYTESAQEALRKLKTERKVERKTVGLEMPYSLYNIVRRMIDAHNGMIEDEEFGVEILVIARFVTNDLNCFTIELRERTAGAVLPVDLD